MEGEGRNKRRQKKGDEKDREGREEEKERREKCKRKGKQKRKVKRMDRHKDGGTKEGDRDIQTRTCFQRCSKCQQGLILKIPTKWICSFLITHPKVMELIEHRCKETHSSSWHLITTLEGQVFKDITRVKEETTC